MGGEWGLIRLSLLSVLHQRLQAKVNSTVRQKEKKKLGIDGADSIVSSLRRDNGLFARRWSSAIDPTDALPVPETRSSLIRWPRTGERQHIDRLDGACTFHADGRWMSWPVASMFINNALAVSFSPTDPSDKQTNKKAGACLHQLCCWTKFVPFTLGLLVPCHWLDHFHCLFSWGSSDTYSNFPPPYSMHHTPPDERFRSSYCCLFPFPLHLANLANTSNKVC